MKKTRLLLHGTHGPWGDASKHLPREEIERQLADLSPPKDRGVLVLLVSRADDGERSTPKRAQLSVEEGVPGDAWVRDAPGEYGSQITLMRVDFGKLVANGQSLTFFGDNLIVDLDLSVANLPTGTRLCVGSAVLEVTPEPHTGCMKYRKRFGKDALKITADERYRDLRLRGIYAKVVEAGEVSVGDTIAVAARP